MAQVQPVLSGAFSQVIKKHREKRKLSRTALAEMSGLHQTYVGLLERGERSPNLHTAKAIASALGYARVWDTASWREEATLRGFLNAVVSVTFSLDGQRLATGGSNPDDAVKLWDVDSWQEVLTLEGAGSLFGLTAFSPDGNAIGTLSGDGILHVWRAPSWAEITAAEAKDPPSPGYGGQGKAEIKQP